MRPLHSPRRFAFVVPRFGESIAGGAETLVGALAQKLSQRGDSVQVLTTCARDNRTWANEFPPGEAVEFGLPVKRFPVDERNLNEWVPRQIKISEGMVLPLQEQFAWLHHGVNSRELYEYIAAKGADFEALFFAPYLFATTFWGALIHPARSYLIPCLHDEAYAYVEAIQGMFRQVRGAIFNAAPERELARSLYGDIKGGAVGMGFEPLPAGYAEALTPYFPVSFPYLVYVGRKETGKNVPQLIDYFIAGKDRGDIDPSVKLVIVGAGSFSDLHRPEALKRADIIDIVHVSERDKHRLIRHAMALCQPSCNESFSIVLMEAWLLGVPVLVHARCAVTKHHAIESGGGLYFATADDLSGVVRELFENAALRGALADAGGQYVRREYAWDAVLERFDRVMNEFLPAPGDTTGEVTA
jgi:glycosyltransferase involved in cell wall biosynthesis